MLLTPFLIAGGSEVRATSDCFNWSIACRRRALIQSLIL